MHADDKNIEKIYKSYSSAYEMAKRMA